MNGDLAVALFLNLLLGHLLGDFVLQPGRLVIAKRDGAPGLLLHTAIVAACTLAVVSGTLARDWPAALLVTGLHLVVERFTILTYLKTPTRGLFTLLLDQTMHALSIALVVWLVGAWHLDGQAVTFGLTISTRTLASVVGVLTVSLFGSILAFETVNSIGASEDFKGRVLQMDGARIAGFVERGAALVAALTLHPALVVVPFVPRIAFAIATRDDERKRLLAEAAAGLALCVAALVAVELVADVTTGAVDLSVITLAPGAEAASALSRLLS